jgi:hypothetical protein
MPKANPFVQISKKLASLQAKSAKVNEELKALAVIVDVEMKKVDAAPVPVKVAPAKAPVKTVTPKALAKAPVKAAVAAPKKAPAPDPKRGRPSKK